MSGILPQIRPEQVAHIMNGQCIGRAGDDTAGTAHAVFDTADLSCCPALPPHRDTHVTGLLTALAVDTLFCVHPDAIKTGMIEQAEGSAERAEVAAVEAVAGDGGKKKGSEIGETHDHRKTANQGCGPGIGRKLGGDHHPNVPDEKKPLGMTQPPGPVAAQGDAPEWKSHGFPDAYTGAAEAADDAASKQEYQQQGEEEGEGSGRMQSRKDRLGPDETGIGFEHWCEPGNQPP